MKVIKEKSRTYKGKPYYKFRINIPEVFLLSAGIKAGDHLEIRCDGEEITLKKVKDKEKSPVNTDAN